MKQLTLEELIKALGDKPASIEDRLKMLGVEDEILSQFSSEVLKTRVYGTSFIKFLEDNKGKFAQSAKIPSKPLPADFVNPFDDDEMTLEKRLVATGLTKDEARDMFEEDALNLELNGDEFQQFIETNREKFIGGLKKIAES